MDKPLALTELVLRDGHQSLLATRFRTEDMLPIADKLDQVGFWSLETWGGATFDSCIRFLGEDPWERLRKLKQAMPKTPHQMLLRGQNLLGYRHYADDVVYRFVERAKATGIDVFRIFDALNDIRNLKVAIQAGLKVNAHVQGTLSYTTSPVHHLNTWLDFARQLEDLGCHSICIKDMSGLLRPYEGEVLISALKENLSIPIALHCHATTGLSLLTQMKAIDAGVDMIDTAISSMSMTYGHSPTETLVAATDGTKRSTNLKLELLEEIADYFRKLRLEYAAFEGQLKGIDTRILTAQVPGGMLTNMENQLREQNALERMDEVLKEIPKVRKELGYLPLVTPASQIVGTQSVLNVLTGERYKTITRETAGILKGEYGQTPAPVDTSLQQRVLEGQTPITHRPADDLPPEFDKLQHKLEQLAQEQTFTLADNLIDDTLTYALFPKVGVTFFRNRHNKAAFEPHPRDMPAPRTVLTTPETSEPACYQVKVNDEIFEVEVSGKAQSTKTPTENSPIQTEKKATTQEITAPLAGQVYKIVTHVGVPVASGDVVLILEAMKMETEIRSTHAGTVCAIHVQEGHNVSVGTPLVSIQS